MKELVTMLPVWAQCAIFGVELIVGIGILAWLGDLVQDRSDTVQHVTAWSWLIAWGAVMVWIGPIDLSICF